MATLFSFKKLFTNENEKINKIIIPIIQRDYAQGREEVESVRTKFLDALYKSLIDKPITLDFIYGDIKDGILTPLDGQQRLTTLFLLYWYAAKKEHIDKQEYEFLKNFSYETRYSSRKFCKELIDLELEFDENTSKLSDIIMNYKQFPNEWEKDPTVRSMLKMLDCIHQKFYSIENMWNKLENSITFYFLSISDMGLTDELYVKMNSRGKPLTTFENLKAELEYELKQNNEIDYRTIIRNIDGKWTDFLWPFRDKDYLIDDAFLHYFRFICDIICYKEGNSPKIIEDELDLVNDYFNHNNPNQKNNVILMSQFLDCWEKIYKNWTIDDFFASITTKEHAEGKIIVETENLLRDAFEDYGNIKNGRRSFPLTKMILLYAFVIYLINFNNTYEDECLFKRRIRIINNLINNSNDEISDSENRSGSNRIPAILEQVDSIILHGTIKSFSKKEIDINFNGTQVEEEIEKLKWTNTHSIEENNKLFKLEDNRLLRGRISIIGLDNFELFDCFEKLFTNNSYENISKALLTKGNYALRMSKEDTIYELGAIGEHAELVFRELFHPSTRQIGNTHDVLIELLKSQTDFNEPYLALLITDYIKKCEEEKQFDWRYYFIKYNSFTKYDGEGRYGKYEWNDFEKEPYMLTFLTTPKKKSEYSYNPFLKELESYDKNIRINFPYGETLLLDNGYIKAINNGYEVYSNNNILLNKIEIEQENGIDKEDRIIKMRKYIEDNMKKS